MKSVDQIILLSFRVQFKQAEPKGWRIIWIYIDACSTFIQSGIWRTFTTYQYAQKQLELTKIKTVPFDWLRDIVPTILSLLRYMKLKITLGSYEKVALLHLTSPFQVTNFPLLLGTKSCLQCLDPVPVQLKSHRATSHSKNKKWLCPSPAQES